MALRILCSRRPSSPGSWWHSFPHRAAISYGEPPFSSLFAPKSPYRKDITLRSELKKGFQFGDDAAEGKKKSEFKNYTWSKMLAQVLKIDVTKCGQCGGDLVKVCAVTDLMQARRYLKHLGLDYEPPPRAPPRCEQGEFHCESDNLPQCSGHRVKRGMCWMTRRSPVSSWAGVPYCLDS